MTEAIEFPDAEALVVTYLNARYLADATFGTVKAAVTVPATRPAALTRVYRIGGSVPSLVVERVTLIVDCYATKSVTASGLMRRTLAYLLAVNVVSGVQFYDPQVFAGPSNLPDPNVATQSRYTATFSVGVRGTAL
jgi:hypothetical protein